MERLTWHNGENWTQVQSPKVGYKPICAKLAAYEDTGLEPEEIPTGLELANTYAAMLLLKRYQGIGSVEEFRTLNDELNTAKRSICEMCRKRGEEQHILCACISCKYGGNHDDKR